MQVFYTNFEAAKTGSDVGFLCLTAVWSGGTEPAMFVVDVAKQHDAFVCLIVFIALMTVMSAGASFLLDEIGQHLAKS